MCTIYTYTLQQAAPFQARIHSDWERNNDGATALFFKDGKCVMKFSSLELISFMAVLVSAEGYDRVFVHLRAATQGAKSIANCHGWGDRATGTTYVMHNGILSSRNYAVDSQRIVADIEMVGVDGALTNLEEDFFANVFIIDERSGIYYVSKGIAGSLHMDDSGNFSSYWVKDASVYMDVPKETLSAFDLRTGELIGTQDFTNKRPVTATSMYPYDEWSGDYDWTAHWQDRPLYSYRNPDSGEIVQMTESELQRKISDLIPEIGETKLLTANNEETNSTWEAQILASKSKRRQRRERKAS